MVNTKTVRGRRKVRYESLDDLLAEAERLADVPVRTLGNWSQGQIYDHLARSLDSSIDGVGFQLPLPMRMMLSLFMKKKFLKKELPPGLRSTPRFDPAETTVSEALEALRKSVARQQNESARVPHPAFCNIVRDGWNDFHLRHAERHMSFLVNGDSTAVGV